MLHLCGSIEADEAHAEIDGESHEMTVHDASVCFTLKRETLGFVNQTNWQTQTSPSSLKCLIRTIIVVHNYFGRKINKRFFGTRHGQGFAALVWFSGSDFICAHPCFP